MNRLQLAQRLKIECGESGTLSTTIDNTDGLQRLVNWIDTAWQELQNKHDRWGFLRSSSLLGKGAQFQTVNGQSSYPLGTGLGTCGVTPETFTTWDTDTFRGYTTANGYRDEIFLQHVSYDVWRDSYMYGAMRDVRTRNVAIAIGPDHSVCLGPVPNDKYTITGDYYIAPTAMVEDTDTPTGLLAQFHMILVYDGMRMYADYESAPEVYSRGDMGYQRLLRQLEAKYLPQMTWSGALA